MSAINKALERVEAKAKPIATHLMEPAESDVELKGGEFVVVGTDKKIAFANVALAAYTAHNLPPGTEPGLKEGAFYDPQNFTFPAGTYVCEVEVDPKTGGVEIIQFTAADDFRAIVNPMIVESQAHSGLAQGVGQALLEGGPYDRDRGQPVTAGFIE